MLSIDHRQHTVNQGIDYSVDLATGFDHNHKLNWVASIRKSRGSEVAVAYVLMNLLIWKNFGGTAEIEKDDSVYREAQFRGKFQCKSKDSIYMLVSQHAWR